MHTILFECSFDDPRVSTRKPSRLLGALSYSKLKKYLPMISIPQIRNGSYLGSRIFCIRMKEKAIQVLCNLVENELEGDEL